MFKRIFLLLLVLASVGVIIFTLWKSDVKETLRETLLHHVSADALLILDVEDAQSFHAKLKEGSVLWPDLGAIPWASHLDKISADIDSVLAPTYSAYPDSACTYVLSLHPSGPQDYSWMLTMGLNPDRDLQSLVQLAKGYIPSDKKEYNGSTIYTLSSRTGDLYATQVASIIYLSNNSLNLEGVHRAGTEHMMDRADFLASYATRGKHSLAHLHVDWSRFPSVLNTLFPQATGKHLAPSWGGWATSDILTDANSIYIHGLVHASDSLGHSLDLYRRQGAGSFEDFLALCPSSTASFSYQHISDPAQWVSKPISEDGLTLAPLLGPGLFTAQLETTDASTEKSFTILRSKDETALRNWLEEQSNSTEEVMGNLIYTDLDPSALSSIYEDETLTKLTYAHLRSEHLIMSASREALKEIFLQLETGRVLSEDKHFEQLSDDMDDEASLCHYFNIARCTQLIESKASPALVASLTDNPASLQQFQALVIQYEPASDGLFHQNILLRHNPIYKKETSSLWESELDTLFESAVHLTKNHRNGQYELLVQDTRNDLHLLDNTGRELWRVSINEPILSPITQVDLYRNKKLQLAFNTPTRFIVLDRNGKMVEGFPVLLSDSASSHLSVMDYDNNKKYRFLIATKDGLLHNYDHKGKAVDGWKYKQTDEPIIGEITHFQIGRKDYICVIGSEGSLRFLERNGKLRYAATEPQMMGYNEGYYLTQPGKNIKETRIIFEDREGMLQSIEVEGALKVISENTYHDFGHVQAYVRHDDNTSYRMVIGKDEGTEIRHNLSRAQSSAQVLTADLTGIADHEMGLYYIYDSAGQLLTGFPLPGRQAAVLDLNKDGVLDAIIWDGKSVSMYSLSVE